MTSLKSDISLESEQAREWEKTLLGIILTDAGALRSALGKTVPEDFGFYAHQVIFKKIQALSNSGPVDWKILSGNLNGESLVLADLGGLRYIQEAADLAFDKGTNIDGALEELKDLRTKRESGSGMGPDGFRAESILSLLSEPEKPTDWLIEDVWVNGRGFVAGDPGVGKTWFCLGMGLSICSGTPFLGRFKIPKPGPVLFVGEEESRSNLRAKIDLLRRGMNLAPHGLKDFYHLTQKFIKFPEMTEFLIGETKRLGCRAIFFDAFRRFHSGNENSSTELQPILDSFAKVGIESGASVVIIHHLSKASESNRGRNVFSRLRGSGDLWAWRDSLVGIEAVDDADGDLARVGFQFRDAPEPPIFGLRRAFNPEQRTLTLNYEEDAEMAEILARVLDEIRFAKEPPSGNQLAKQIGGRKAKVLAAVKALKAEGKIQSSGKGWVVPDFPEPMGTSSSPR